ncbi:hypothetical protein Tfont_01377 [Tepidimonas fonticaldi]|uniref:Uncharacterized protein n=1 Tax=Tepidimonas fonticaldi TaxID=1101373 RepID=A0A554XMW3_9BURK|nr:hypothetical protein Tfont_01377 [Tepidimonas fonticaldi]
MQLVALGRGQRAVFQHGQHAQHPVEGGAQLVAHVGQELALGAVGGFGRVACAAQSGVERLQLGALVLLAALAQPQSRRGGEQHQHLRGHQPDHVALQAPDFLQLGFDHAVHHPVGRQRQGLHVGPEPLHLVHDGLQPAGVGGVQQGVHPGHQTLQLPQQRDVVGVWPQRRHGGVIAQQRHPSGKDLLPQGQGVPIYLGWLGGGGAQLFAQAQKLAFVLKDDRRQRVGLQLRGFLRRAHLPQEDRQQHRQPRAQQGCRDGNPDQEAPALGRARGGGGPAGRRGWPRSHSTSIALSCQIERS